MCGKVMTTIVMCSQICLAVVVPCSTMPSLRLGILMSIVMSIRMQASSSPPERSQGVREFFKLRSVRVLLSLCLAPQGLLMKLVFNKHLRYLMSPKCGHSFLGSHTVATLICRTALSSLVKFQLVRSLTALGKVVKFQKVKTCKWSLFSLYL